MSVLAAEHLFNEALAALADSRDSEAAALCRHALEIERQRGVAHPDLRYLSYYGLSVARAGGDRTAAVRACETAAAGAPMPALLLNLGRVYLIAGKPAAARRCFERGVLLAPQHRPLRDELVRLERGAAAPRRPLRRWLRWLRRPGPAM